MINLNMKIKKYGVNRNTKLSSEKQRHRNYTECIVPNAPVQVQNTAFVMWVIFCIETYWNKNKDLEKLKMKYYQKINKTTTKYLRLSNYQAKHNWTNLLLVRKNAILFYEWLYYSLRVWIVTPKRELQTHKA